MKISPVLHSLLRAVTVSCLSLLAVLPLAAQQPSTEAATIQALLQEVRALRLTLERTSTLVPRLQLTIARFQMQQDRVERLDRELRTLRTQLSTDASGREHMVAALRQFEEQSRQSQDPGLRKQSEEAANGMRAELEQQTLREQQGRGQEADMALQLKVDQAKLNELSAQLDQLDKQMQRP